MGIDNMGFSGNNVIGENSKVSPVEQNIDDKCKKKPEKEGLVNGFEQETYKEIDKIYHDHYHGKHLANGVKQHSLIKDPRDKTLYPMEPGIFNLRQKYVLNLIRSYTCMVPDNVESYENAIRDMFEKLKTGNVAIIVNHDTFANIPEIVSELHMYADKWNMPEIKESITTILGPSLATQTQINVISSVSRVMKTVPDTWNSDIEAIKNSDDPKIKSALNYLRVKFLKTILSEIENVNEDLEDGERKYGYLYIIAPTGMRDYLQWNNDCTIDSIMFENDKKLRGSLALIKKMLKDNVSMYMMGTNGVGMKRPSKVTEKDNNRVPADTYVAAKSFSQEEVLKLLDDGVFMEELAGLVKDNDGNNVGKVLDREDLKDLWDNKKIQKMQEDNFRNFHFHDDIKKIVSRLLYKTFENIRVRYFIKNNAKNLVKVLKLGKDKK